MIMDFLHIKHVSLTYGQIRILDDIDLVVSKGEFVTIVGPSGCGKSSLLKMVTGIQAPSEGEILFQGEAITDIDAKRGMMLQEATLFPWLSVRDNISFALKMKSVSRKEQVRQADAYLDLMGLSEFADHLPYQLSGGMKQRTALARTLINRPEMIMMDEPFSALDAFTRKSMQKLLTQIWKDFQTTFLFVTHDVEEAITLGSRVIILSARPGKVIEDLSIGTEKKEAAARIFTLLEQ
ncbi:ABC transporter ATP-binding protein [Ammoniphilus resinae]|uniref:ABC-type nitrate/sulfonate/bicarbonate transport system ATPase subunit n=1 Tax=Ammoniphilus resinae TaxID=861532 RepID=A0ABS4GWM1_9BACL|nr:ABC transporter ATP-binding protein [Ammoniphilus resinae]MBP1934497.1 ABC-type nitrate/sulfonate/bicarbonate transport system ATPase subunit [Ammoniphilus resinae]